MTKAELIDTLEKMTEAGDTLKWLSDSAELELPVSADLVQMVGVLALARSYLTEFAAHRARGLDRGEALSATVKGELDASAGLDTHRKSLN